ncbi:MAG TPA: hypothetical protein VN446_02870 [Candidatus Acidoferrum sp.]|nr:hypothetical protein [Candidatus Acidoferrum sp.]
MVHTLLFFIRRDHYAADLAQARRCLESLADSAHKNTVIYNQGCLSNDELSRLVSKYDLECTILGEGKNIGIVAGRQRCFEYIWSKAPKTKFISELHLDMIFPPGWENSLLDYLGHSDEPVISSGIVDGLGQCAALPGEVHALPREPGKWAPFLLRLRQDKIVPGFVHPCIHNSKILREVGGYDLAYLQGNQCYEDDSLLLGYYLYYGTRADWQPKINYNSVVYHEVAAQRLGLDDCIQNYVGLIRQYGLMGQKYLGRLHANPTQKAFFSSQYHFLCGAEKKSL